MTSKLTKLTDLLLRQHSAVILCFHITLILWSLLFSWLLRFEFSIHHPSILLAAAPILVLVRLAAMSRFGLLHGHWRYTGVEDAAEILKATVLGSIGFFAVMRFVLGVTAFPFSVYIIEMVISGCLVAGVRLACRVVAEAATRVPPANERRQVLIIGAGFAAQMIIRELRENTSGYWVVGCVDDDPQKVGLRILGKPVLGTLDQLGQIAVKHMVKDALIAVPSATGAQMRRIVERCEAAGLKFSTVPTLHDLIAGKASIQDLRPVDLDDLLGRDPIKVDLDSVQNAIRDNVVLVTGAAGSIGSELCRQVLQYRPAKLICLDQNETGLFYLQMELGDQKTVYCVADYSNTDRMRRLFLLHRIQIVFHAGAYKHVPLMEANPREALQNNVFGLLNLLDVAESSKCDSFILISSDKAVNPTNVMGTTKRMGELILSSRPTSRTRCVSVRFGNVLGSQGSVVPVFQKQLLNQKRVTVTHPDITRYFMTIREAVSLVLQASAIGKHGDILVLDMGEPVKIVDLAKTLISLSGKSEREIDIVFTGLRPGEKLYEELFYENEEVLDTSCVKIKQTRSTKLSWTELTARLQDLRQTMFNMSDAALRSKIRAIIPQYEFESESDWFSPSPEIPPWQIPHPSCPANLAAGDD